MKTIALTLSLLLATALSLVAQDKTPRSEFAVELSAATLEVAAGQTKDITLSILASKSFARSKAQLKLASGVPQGVTVTFTPAEGIIEKSVVTITADPQTAPGNYTLILNTTIRQKSKGATLRLVVTDSTKTLSAQN
jgi:uncharacterized membrane protein